MTASPLPVVVHIVSAVPYAVLGAFQFSTRLRLRHPLWHRMAGRLVVVLRLVVALSALWMTRFSARQPGTGVLAHDLGLGAAWALNLVVAEAVIRRHRGRRHAPPALLVGSA